MRTVLASVRASLIAFMGGLVLILGSPTSASADALSELRAGGVLIWGGDQEGGGPYILPRPDDPEQVTGFEVELAAQLASYLNVKPQFYQGQWDKQLDLLRASKVHVVLNGYEWRPERADLFDATIPYFVYGLQLLGRDDAKSRETLSSVEALRNPNADLSRRRVGVLTGSAAEEYMRSQFGETCETINYDGNTDAMRDVENGKLDATLQDTPIARYYAANFPHLRAVGSPVAPGHYVAYVRKGETALLAALNEAIILLIRNGGLERIYRSYGIWDEPQAALLGIAEHGKFYGYVNSAVRSVEKAAPLPTSEEVKDTVQRVRGFEVVEKYGFTLLKSAGLTVLLALISFPLAILIGLTAAIGRLYGPGYVRVPLTVYVELIRGTPLMLQLYFIFFLLPELGLNIPAFTTAIMGLAINYSAYEAEIYRAGLQSVPPGQMEAALSLGMSKAQAIRRIIVPQAFRIVIPPVVNDFIALFKDTSVCSVVTLVELTKRFSVLAMSTQAIVEMAAMTCVLYLLMSYPLSLLSRQVERRLGVGVVT